MRKLLIATTAFVLSATVGALLLLAASHFWFLLEVRHPSGIGAIAGGVSEVAVSLVALLCGLLGTILALNRLNRTKA